MKNKEDNFKQKEVAQKKEKPAKEKVIKIKEPEYQKLVADLAECKDKNLRLYAEFDNARKRMDRDKQEFVKYANEGIIVEFLDILDDLQRSIDAAKVKHEDYDAFLKGIEMVMVRINDMLKRRGVQPLDVKGKAFDPHRHEVLLQEDNDEVEEDTILEEFQKGYSLGEKIIRTAKVKLSKKSQQHKGTSAEEENNNY